MKGLVTEGDEEMVKVHIIRQEACGHCKACFSGFMKQDMDINAKNICEAEVGDWVELELQENAFLNAVLISYGIPLIGFIAGILFGNFVLGPLLPISVSLTAFVSGLIGVAICYMWIKTQNRKWENGKYVPIAVRLTTEGYGAVEGQCSVQQ